MADFLVLEEDGTSHLETEESTDDFLMEESDVAPPPEIIAQQYPTTHQWRGLSNEYWRDIALGGELLMPTPQIRYRVINYRDINEKAYFQSYDVSTTFIYLESATVTVFMSASATDTADFTDSNTVLVDLQNSAVELREIPDADTVYVDIQTSATEFRESTDSDSIYVDIQSSGIELRESADADAPYVDIQASGADVYTPGGVVLTDADTVLVDLQSSGIELREVTDTGSVYVDLQTSATDTADFVDSATPYIDLQSSGTELRETAETGSVYIDIQASSTDTADFVDSATPYVDLQSSGTELQEFVETATVYVHIQIPVYYVPIQLVQNFYAAGGGFAGPTVITIPAGGVAVGNTLTLYWTSLDAAGTLTGVTDSKGNAYTIRQQAVLTGSNARAAIVSAYITSALAPGDTIAVAYTGNGGPTMVSEWSGLATSSYDQQAQQTSGLISTYTSGLTPTTTQANELIYGAHIVDNAGRTFTPDAPMIEIDEQSPFSSWQMETAYRIVSAIGTYESSGTHSVPTSSLDMVSTFRAAGIDILRAVDTAIVLLALQASGVDTYTPPAVLAAYVIQPPYIV